MNNKFTEMPSITGVMELLAKYKKTDIKDLILDFANMKDITNHISIDKKEASINNNYKLVNNAQFPFKHEQFMLSLKTPYTLKSGKTVLRFEAFIDDFDFNIFCTTKLPTENNDIRLFHKDFSQNWRKMLFEFDKDYMFNEFSELMEYRKEKSLEEFYKDYKENEK